MKIYFLVEGAQTEKKIFRAWLAHCFPSLTEVFQPSDLKDDSFFLLAGMGYPSYLQRIPSALEDAARYSADHLFICIDSEEHSYEERRTEVQSILEASRVMLQGKGLQHVGQQHIIVASCCVESWLLGHRRFVPRQPSSQVLSGFKRFYDVSTADPELMGNPQGYMTRAQFHFEYLREVFQHHSVAYSKANPGFAKDATYLAALRERCLDTTHTPPQLESFRILWETWAAMGARS